MNGTTPKSRTLAELLVENSLDGLLAVDREHRYTLWNRTMEQFAGKRADEVLGRRVFDVFPFLRDRGLDVALERALAGETVTAEAVPYDLPDGSRRYHDRIYLPLRDGGEIVGMLGIVRDVTARREAEDALRASEERLRVAVDAAGVGLWSWDAGTDEVRWEDSLRVIFGVAPGFTPASSEAYYALVHPEDRAGCAERIARGVEQGRWEHEYRIVRSCDGAVRWIMAKASVVGNTIQGATIDVTERVERDEKLRQSQKLEAVGQLTAGIAHNFNNMLMGMLPNLERATRGAPEELRPLLRDVEESAQRAAKLVRQLMTYAGRNSPAARGVESVATVVERVVALCRTTFDRRIAFQTSYDRSARARVDPAQLEQAVLNALINARDALDETDAPRVTVTVDVAPAGSPELEGRSGDHVRIRVGDNGAGMDAATAGRIFEPFFTTKPVGRGTGLGLATTRAILLEHGGFVTCESTPRRGSTFSFYLPRETGAPDERRIPPVKAPIRGSETVLVVDDEPLLRKLTASILTEAGFQAKLAASGAEAIALLADARTAEEVALVLLDVSMPGMSGREVRHHIRALAPHARVVYFSGYAFDAADADDAVLEKPASEQRLLATIREVLDRRPSPG